MTQLIFNSLIEPSEDVTQQNFSIEYNPETDYIIEDTIIRITPITVEEYEQSTTKNTNNQPHFSPAIYPSLTEVVGNDSILQRGDLLDLSTTSKYELIDYVPVDRGYHYWYDLQLITEDKDQSTTTLTTDRLAIEFHSSFDVDIMAIAFNLSDILTPIVNSLDIYLADNLDNYLYDYMMYSDLSYNSYNAHKNNLNSPLLFSFWQHPLTTPVSNSLTADTPYYIIIESEGSFTLQTSLDNQGSDENKVYTNVSGVWTEQPDLDIDLEIYTGSLVQSSSLGSGGTSNLLYDSTLTTGVNHKIVTNYYDNSLIFDSSSDFHDFTILDSFSPEFLHLTTPLTAEYGDEIQLIARVENSYHQPLQGELIDFYVSSDNSSWTFLSNGSSEADGYSSVPYIIPEATGTQYFKAVLNLLAAYSSTEQEKETVLVTTPLIECVYGSATGSHNLAQFQLSAQLLDNEGNPVVNQMVIFFMQGSLDPIFTYTNNSGWATSGNGYISWNSGYYSNSYWLSLSMDSDLYIYPSTTYGDINILKNNLTISSEESIVSLWNDAFDIHLGFSDSEGDKIPNLNHEIIVHNINTGHNTSLGLFQSDAEGDNILSFAEEFFDPDEYLLIIKVDVRNYQYLERSISLTINSDKAVISVNVGSIIDYVYGSTLFLEIYVADHSGNPLENIQVYVHVSLANFIDFWYDIIVINTNSSGYASLNLILDMDVGDDLNILFNTADYAFGGVVYYEGADSLVSFVNCLPTQSSFEGLSDIYCDNQETITITGRLLSNGNPLGTQSIKIIILGEIFTVITDSEGYFNLVYQVPQGGNIIVTIVFDSSDNYVSVNESITLYSSPSSLTLTGEDIHHTTTDPVILTVQLMSPYGTNPQGVAVEFYWFDGNSWIHLDTIYSDLNGIASFVSGMIFPLGNFQWKARVNSSDDWQETAITHILQIGIETHITIYSSSTIEYQETLTITALVLDEYAIPLLTEVYFYIDGVLIGSAFTNSGGYATLDWIVNLTPGSYQINVYTANTGMYLEAEASEDLTIEKTSSYISCDDEFMFYSENAVLLIYLYSSTDSIANVFVHVSIAGILDNQILTNGLGLAFWNIPLLEPGVYTVRIFFAGNNLYYESELFINLQVDKMPTTVTFTAPNQDYEPIYTISGYIEDEFNQPIENVELSLIINGSVIDTTSSDVFGYFEFTTNLLPGIYNIEVVYSGDNHYLASNNQKTIHIWKIDTSIHTDVEWLDLTVTVEALLLDSHGSPISGQLIFFYLDGVYVNHIVTNGTGYAVITLTDVVPGTYVLEVVYSGTTIYSSSSKTIVIDHDKLQTEMSVSVTEGIYGTVTTTIEVYLTSKGNPLAGQNLILIINGQQYGGITNSSGYLLMSLDLFKAAGSYSLTVQFLGDVIYAEVSIGTSFSISKAESLITLQFGYDNYFPTLTGTLFTPAVLIGEELQIYDFNNVLEIHTLLGTAITDTNGDFEFILLLVTGTYLIEVDFEGDSNHLSFNKTIQIEIYKTTLQISAPSNITQTYGEETSFNIYVEDALGNPLSVQIIVKIDGTYYTTITTDVTGYATISLTAGIEAGNHIITLEFQGNYNYYQTSKNVALNTKYDIILEELIISPGAYGDEGQISGRIHNYNGDLPLIEIVLYYNGQTYTTNIDMNGNFAFIIEEYLEVGSYLATLRINETSLVLLYEYIFNIEKTKGQADIIIDNTLRTYNDESNVIGYVMFDSIGFDSISIDIRIDGIYRGTLTTDENGMFIIPGFWLLKNPGEYILTIVAQIYDPNIDTTSDDFSLTITKGQITADISAENTKVEQDLLLSIFIEDSHNNPLKGLSINIEINGTLYTVTTNSYGEASISYSLIGVGVLYVLLSSSETSLYLGFTQAFEIIVEKTETVIELKQTEIPFGNSAGLAIVLKSEFGNVLANKQLLVIIDLDATTPITDENGTVYIDVSGISLGNHSILVDFAGSENYLETDIYAYIEIIKISTKLNIIYIDSTPYLQLLDDEETPLILREVTFNYLNSSGDIIASEIYRTDLEGLILLDFSSNSNADKADGLQVIFEGESYYSYCDLKIAIQELIKELRDDLESFNFDVLIPVGIVLAALSVVVFLLIKRRKV